MLPGAQPHDAIEDTPGDKNKNVGIVPMKFSLERVERDNTKENSTGQGGTYPSPPIRHAAEEQAINPKMDDKCLKDK